MKKKDLIWSDYFAESSLLNQSKRTLLYFNLPWYYIQKEIKPELVFTGDPKMQENLIKDLIETFEERNKREGSTKRLANLLLLKVKGDDETHLIGGFATEGWLRKFDNRMRHNPEESFLFNFNLNLRFNSVKDRAPYQSLDVRHCKYFSFGQKALYLADNLNTVSSHIPLADVVEVRDGREVIGD